MKEDLHNDGLEDFLQKSFEQYDDSPSDDLWDRIETDLSVPPKIVPLNPSPYWWIGAAAAVVIGLVVGQHIFYKNKIGQLTQQVEGQSIELLERGNKIKERDEVIQELKNKDEKNGELLADEKTMNKTENNSVKNGNQLFTIKEKTVPVEKQNQLFTNQKNELGHSENPKNILSETNNTTIQNNKNNDTNFAAKLNFIKNIELKKIAYEKPKTDLSAYPINLMQNIKPVQKNNGISVGLHTSRLQTEERVKKQFGGSQQSPFPSAYKGSTKMAGLSISKELKNNWFVQSGLNYRQSELSADTELNFKFGDFKPGSGSHQHEIELPIITPSGAVALQINAEQETPGEIIDEDEGIQLKIKTSLIAKKISVPLLAGYRLGNGRIQVELKTGVVANYLMDNEFKINKAEIISTKFKRNSSRSPRGSRPDVKDVTLDYLASAGVRFNITPNMALHAAPTIIKSISSRHNHPLITSSEFSAGVDVGVSYRF